MTETENERERKLILPSLFRTLLIGRPESREGIDTMYRVRNTCEIEWEALQVTVFEKIR